VRPSLREVERVIAGEPEASGVIVCDGDANLLASRAPAPGGGAVLIALGVPEWEPPETEQSRAFNAGDRLAYARTEPLDWERE
jgi:hypothetical protein